jgi:hypothetical protein
MSRRPRSWPHRWSPAGHDRQQTALRDAPHGRSLAQHPGHMRGTRRHPQQHTLPLRSCRRIIEAARAGATRCVSATYVQDGRCQRARRRQTRPKPAFRRDRISFERQACDASFAHAICFVPAQVATKAFTCGWTYTIAPELNSRLLVRLQRQIFRGMERGMQHLNIAPTRRTTLG